MGNYFVLEYNRKSLLESKADHERFMKWISDGYREHGYHGAKMSDWGIKVYAKSAYDTFMKVKPSLKSPENDMYHWMKGSFPDFSDFISKEQKRIYDAQKLRDAEKGGSRLVYSDNDWKVYEITNYEASAKYGKNTRWCISGSKRWDDGDGLQYFQRYHDDENVRFFFFLDQRNNRKYALCLYPDNENWEIYNDHDIRVPAIPNAPVVDEIVDLFGSKDAFYGIMDPEKEVVMSIAEGNMSPEFFNRMVQLWMGKIGREDVFLAIAGPKDARAWIEQGLPDGYLEHDAVANGSMTEEEYYELTGEEYEEYWAGDFPEFANWDDLPNAEKGKEAVLDSIPSDKYALFMQNGMGENVTFHKDMRDAVLEASYFKGNIAVDLANCLIEEMTSGKMSPREVATELHVQEPEEFISQWNTALGIKESMDEGASPSQEDFFKDSVVRNKDGELLPMWHCSTDTFTKFRNRINWFSVSKDYARQFGLSKPVFYQAYLNCRKLLNCGDTGQLVYLPFPTRKVLSPAILKIADRLGISKDEMEELCQYTIKDNQEEGSDGMRMRVHAITRTDAFAEKAKEKGFDGIHTVEDGHHCIGVLNPSDIKRVTNLEPTDSQDIDEAIGVTEMKSKGILDDQHIQDLVDECIDRCKEIDMSGVNFDGYPDLGSFYQEITFKRIYVEVGDAMRTFGTFVWGDDDSPNAGGTIILNKYMFSEPDEVIKNTIYHELCHYIVWQLGCWSGIYYKLDDKWRIERSAVVRPSDWDSHGRIWQTVADVVGSAVGQKITRTDSYRNHTGVGSHAEDQYKYIVKCKHCGNEFKYAKRTKFITAVLDGNGHVDRWWCNCKDGFKGHDFEILKGK